MSSISTSFTRLLNVQVPVVSAPMAGASGGSLAAQVTLGGGFGFLSVGYGSVDKVKYELQLARDILQQRSSEHTLHVGAGFLGWTLDELPSQAEALIDLVLDHNVSAVWFAFGHNLKRWIDYVRDRERKIRRQNNTSIFVQVSSVEDARLAAEIWKVDVLVIQGIESGGHGFGSAAPVKQAVSDVLAILPSERPPVLAAGGLANGRDLAEMLSLGAAGAVFGTRFLLTPESLYTDVQKNALLRAGDGSTVRTMAFDRARGTIGWPAGIDGRALYNKTVDDFDKGVDEAVLKEKYNEGTRQGNVDRMLVWAGSGVGSMSQIQPAKAIVQEVHDECQRHLNLSPAV